MFGTCSLAVFWIPLRFQYKLFLSLPEKKIETSWGGVIHEPSDDIPVPFIFKSILNTMLYYEVPLII